MMRQGEASRDPAAAARPGGPRHPAAGVVRNRGGYRREAIPCTSNRALNSSVPAPMKARAGNSFVK